MRRVNIKAILKDPKLRKRLMDGWHKAIVAVGQDGTRAVGKKRRMTTDD